MDYPLPPDPPAPANPPDPLTAEPGTISSAKLTGGTVELAGKVVTGVFHTSDGNVSFFYIQEPMVGGNGIKIVPELSIPIEPGNIVTVKGVLISDPAEVYIYGNVKCTGSMERPGPAGMINLSCAGGEFGEQSALYVDSSVEGSGLNAVGTRVRVWGSVLDTGTESGHALRYIDDGSALSTGTYTGLKVVYWDADDAPTGQYIDGQTGILGAEIVDGKPVPVVRVPEMVPYEVPSCVKYVVPGGSGDGSSWQNAYGSIQNAINAADLTTPKSEVWVAGESTTPYSECITMANGVAVYGGFSGNETLREGRNWELHETIIEQSQYYVVGISDCSSSSTRLDGFTIRKVPGSQYTLSICINCGISDYGYTNNTIISNNEIYNAAIGIYVSAACPFIVNNKIHDNTSTGSGAGIYCDDFSRGIICSPTILNNEIYNNTANYHGGGIRCTPVRAAKILHNSITNNIAGGNGGGIASSNGVSLVIANNTISDNQAGGQGGGVYSSLDTSLILMNNVIIDNTASTSQTSGAGIYATDTSCKIINNTIAWNGADTTGDGIYFSGTNAQYWLYNNIVANNHGAGIRGTTGIYLVLENNDSFGQSQNYLDFGTVPASNISQNPLFDTTSTHNIHLLENSPCIDEGLNDVINIGDQDIDGDARIMDNQVDIGADEVTGCVGNMLTLSPENPRTVIGASAHVQATVIDFMTGEPVSGVQVYVTVNAGEIESVTDENGNTISVNAQSGTGVTNSSGIVDIYVTDSSAEEVDLNASISQCGDVFEDDVTVSFECYAISFIPEEPKAVVSGIAHVQTIVTNPVTGDPIGSGTQISFSINAGNIVSVTHNGIKQSVGATTTYGTTDSDGKIDIYISYDLPGNVILTASSLDCFSENQITIVYDCNAAFSFTPDIPRGPINSSVPVEVTLTHATSGELMEGVRVDFSVDSGQITAITTGNVSEEYGITDSEGKITVSVTRSTSGVVVLSACVHVCECNPQVTKKIWFFDTPNVTADDWPMFMHDEQHTGMSKTWDAGSGSFSWQWEVSLPTASTSADGCWSIQIGQDTIFHPDPVGGSTIIFEHPYIDSSPVVVGNKVVVGTWVSGDYLNATGSVEAFDADDGDSAWPSQRTYTPSMGGVASTPCISNQKVYVGTSNSYLYCLALSDGHQIWAQQTTDRSATPGSSRIISSPVVHNGIVYITNEASKVYAFNADTGAQVGTEISLPIASHGITDVLHQNICGASSPAIATVGVNTYLLVGCDDGYAYRIDVNNWSASPAQVYMGGCVESSPSVSGDYAYIGVTVYQGHNLFRVTVEPFQAAGSWALREESRATASLAFDYAYNGVDTGNTFYRVHDPYTDPLREGLPQFSTTDGSYSNFFVGSAAHTTNGLVYTGNNNGKVYMLDADDLSLITADSTYLNNEMRSSPAISYNVNANHNRWVFITSRKDGGKLIAYKTTIGGE